MKTLISLLMLLSCATAHAEINVQSLVNTIIRAESSGRPHIVGDGGKARGLMQLQKCTWVEHTKEPWSKAFDPKLNREVGTRRVLQIIKKYKTSDPAYVAYRYNCGDYTKLSFSDWKRKQRNDAYRSLYQ